MPSRNYLRQLPYKLISIAERTEIRYNTVPLYATLGLMYSIDVRPKKMKYSQTEME